MPTLDRRPHKAPPNLIFARTESDVLSIPYARLNEVCGPSRRSFALMLAAQMTGPILWIKPSWHRLDLNAQGITNFLDPARITFVEPKRADDVLWSMEETLRTGVVPSVIAECDAPPALTPIRRLHLAAEQGTKMGKINCLALLLAPADGGAQGIETRWHATPCHSADHSRWLIERRRARLSPPASWILDWHRKTAQATPAIPAQNIAAE